MNGRCRSEETLQNLQGNRRSSTHWWIEIVNQVQEVQRVPYRINPRINMPRHILIKLSKIKYKEKILKAAREKQQITHKGIPIRLTADLSTETLQARWEWQEIFKVMKEKNLQPRLLYLEGSH